MMLKRHPINGFLHYRVSKAKNGMTIVIYRTEIRNSNGDRLIVEYVYRIEITFF